VMLYGPTEGRIDEAIIDGRPGSIAHFTHEGRPVTAQTVDVLPGQERTLTFDVVSGPGQPGPPALRVTPGSNGTGVGAVGASTCS